jgi:hypothetical protein
MIRVVICALSSYCKEFKRKNFVCEVGHLSEMREAIRMFKILCSKL